MKIFNLILTIIILFSFSSLYSVDNEAIKIRIISAVKPHISTNGMKETINDKLILKIELHNTSDSTININPTDFVLSDNAGNTFNSPFMPLSISGVSYSHGEEEYNVSGIDGMEYQKKYGSDTFKNNMMIYTLKGRYLMGLSEMPYTIESNNKIIKEYWFSIPSELKKLSFQFKTYKPLPIIIE